jgi:hypothetical protein
MRTRDVPQDDAGVLGGFKELTYAVDDRGRHVGVPCAGYDPANVANHQEWERLDALVTVTADAVRANRLSPLAYWMDLRQMDVPLLAAYTRIWQWRIHRHRRPAIFARLGDTLLRRYAGALRIDVDALRRLPEPLLLPSRYPA